MPSSAAADDGTKTHELAEKILLARLEGQVPPDTSSIESDRLDRIDYYVDVVLSLRDELMEDLEFDEELDTVTHAVETKFHLDQLHKEFYGTNDAALYWNGILHIIDLKDGVGVVSAEHNAQLMYYAIGVSYALGVQHEIKEIHLHIVQPKLEGSDRHKRWEPSNADMKKFMGDLLVAARDVETRPDHCVVGDDQCKWCNTATCETYKKTQKANALTAFGDDADILDVLEGSDTERLTALVDYEDRVMQIFKDARATLQQRALKGESVSGFKLVRKQGNRAWVTTKDVAKELESLGVSKDAMFKQTLLSPTQMQKVMPKGVSLDALVERKDNGRHLVPNKAKGEPVLLGPAFNDGIEGLE